MKKTRLLPLFSLFIMSITIIAFAGGNDLALNQIPDDLPIESPADLTDEVQYIGQILSVMEDGSLLTEGVYGIEGAVIVSLPDDWNHTIELVEGAYLTMHYDGSITENSFPQIWATAVQAVDTEMPHLPAEIECTLS